LLSNDLRKRIAALNRKEPAKPPAPDAESEPPSQPDPDVPERAQPAPARATAGDARLSLPLEAVAAGQVVANDLGVFLRIDRSLPELLPSAGSAFQRRFVRCVASAGRADAAAELTPSLEAVAGTPPEGVLFVDIEATGLTSGTPLFLIGTLGLMAGELKVCQLLARDYSEEAALLSHFADTLSAASVVVSFNGKTYDLPYIRDRSAFCGVPVDLPEAHLDLLHESRRRWRGVLPNCRLQTLERHICRRVRSGDIPGDQIGDAYHRFVQTGNAVDMRDILQHNALDLITLTELTVHILEGRTP
jgi:uncharacterized protein YprB with RNaseH-like and TPR domain